MRVQAVATPVSILVGLVAVAAALYFAPRSDPTSPSYSGYEPVVREWLSMSGFKKGVVVKRLAGPFYEVQFKPGKCLLVDVSTRYKASGDTWDTFWTSAGAAGSTPGGKLTVSACNL